MRLVCFPFGGAGAGWVWPLRSELGAADTELWAVRLPGRESRIAEPFAHDAAEVCECIASELQTLPERTTVFYGHSLGAALACQTAAQLRALIQRLPALLIVSGRSPPHVPSPIRWRDSSEEALIQHLRELGGVPEELTADPRLLALYLPKLRADYVLNESVVRERLPAFPFPITIINGQDDPLVDRERLPQWRQYTTARFESFDLPGGHFFLRTQFREFMRLLVAQLAGVRSEQ